MLILTRRRNEKVLIGDDIKVVICGVEHGQVRLGIEAHPDVHIVREEIAHLPPREAK